MIRYEQATSADWLPALDLLFVDLPEQERNQHVLNGLSMLDHGELDSEGLWLVRDDQHIIGVQVCVLLGGASCNFWIPQLRFGAYYQHADRLVAAALDWSFQQGCKIAQALLYPIEVTKAEPLRRQGFRNITRIVTFRHDLRGLPKPIDSPLRYHPYDDATQDAFKKTLLRTYEGTLDIPELNGLRSVDDILQGHRAEGIYRPERWWLVTLQAQPIGVVLLMALPHSLSWELAYLGLVPEFRRQGFGRAMTQHALDVAARNETFELMISVDHRNLPARKIYQDLGFVPAEERIVLLHNFV